MLVPTHVLPSRHYYYLGCACVCAEPPSHCVPRGAHGGGGLAFGDDEREPCSALSTRPPPQCRRTPIAPAGTLTQLPLSTDTILVLAPRPSARHTWWWAKKVVCTYRISSRLTSLGAPPQTPLPLLTRAAFPAPSPVLPCHPLLLLNSNSAYHHHQRPPLPSQSPPGVSEQEEACVLPPPRARPAAPLLAHLRRRPGAAPRRWSLQATVRQRALVALQCASARRLLRTTAAITAWVFLCDEEAVCFLVPTLHPPYPTSSYRRAARRARPRAGGAAARRGRRGREPPCAWRQRRRAAGRWVVVAGPTQSVRRRPGGRLSSWRRRRGRAGRGRLCADGAGVQPEQAAQELQGHCLLPGALSPGFWHLHTCAPAIPAYPVHVCM